MNKKLSSRPVILKFGGAAVADASSFADVASLIVSIKKKYSHVVTVVSAMAETTNQLNDLAHQVHSSPPRREYDMLVSIGERMSISLLAMALHRKGVEAMSFTGSQSGIITCSNHSDARIVDMRPSRILSCLESGKVAIVAGFQGVSTEHEITTLGRGGSDTTAVALAVALDAEQVIYFKDVAGVYDSDPKKNPKASLLPQLDYQSALALLDKESKKVLHPRSVLLAEKNGIPLHVRSFLEKDPFSSGQGTNIKEFVVENQKGRVYE